VVGGHGARVVVCSDGVWDVYSSEKAIRQGLTLVHYSAQLEPFLTLNTSPKRLNTPSTPALNTP